MRWEGTLVPDATVGGGGGSGGGDGGALFSIGLGKSRFTYVSPEGVGGRLFLGCRRFLCRFLYALWPFISCVAEHGVGGQSVVVNVHIRPTFKLPDLYPNMTVLRQLGHTIKATRTLY